MIRIPAGAGKGARIELRSPDPSANPYLTIAACLMAGLDGIENKIEPPAIVSGNIFTMTKEQRDDLHMESLPGNFTGCSDGVGKG